MSDNPVYAVVWFEDDATFTLTDSLDKTVLIDKQEAEHYDIPILEDEEAINKAEDHTRYAVPPELLMDLFGWTQ